MCFCVSSLRQVAPPSPVASAMPMSMVLFGGDDDDTGPRALAGNPIARVAARRKAAVEEHVRANTEQAANTSLGGGHVAP